MPDFYKMLKYGFVLGLFLNSFSLLGQANVTITPATTISGAKACVGGNYVPLTNIVITETSTGGGLDDDAIGGSNGSFPNVTLILGFSAAGFEFQSGVGSAVASPGVEDVSINSITVTSSTVTVNFNAINDNGGDFFDAITISGLMVRAVSVGSGSTNITRTGGTSVITGLVNGTIVGSVTNSVPPASSLAASANPICAGTSVTFTATPTAQSNYEFFVDAFSVQNGGSNIYTTSSLTNGQSVQVAITNSDGCSAISNTVAMTVNPIPTPIISGSNTVCENLVGAVYNTPFAAGRTYLWSVGGGSITGGTGTNSITVTWGAAGPGTVQLTETINATGCFVVTPVFNVTISPAPTVSNAGANQNVCGTSTALTGNTPTVGTGLWTIVSGAGGSFVLNTNPTTTFNGTAGVTYVLRWTISNGVCTPSASDVTIRLDQAPTVSNAGTPQTVCGTATTLNGNAPTIGTGQWSFAPGGNPDALGSIADINSRVSGFTGTAGITYTLRWTISNGVCPVSTSDVTIQFDQAPTVSNAGANQEQCNNGSFTLAGNSPLIGVGQWSIVAPANGAVITPGEENLPNATVIGLNAGFSVVLRWTITNGVCPSSISNVTLTNTLGPIVNAGSDSETCQGISFNFSTQATLASSSNFSSLLWSHTGTGTIFNANTLTPTYIPGTGETGVVTFTLTANGNGSCASVNDVMTLTITPAVIANAGSDAEVCEGLSYDFSTQTTLASASNFNTLLWTHTGTGTISNETALTPSYAPGVGETGAVTFTLTATGNGSCATVNDQMILNITPAPLVDAGSDAEICQGSSFTFTSQTILATASNYNSLVWMHTGSGTLFNGNTLSPTYFASASETGIVTFTLTVMGNGSCVIVDDQMDITITPAPIANAGSDAEVCEGSPTFDFSSRTGASLILNGSGVWTHNGSGTLDNPALLNPVYTLAAGDFGNTITFTLTVTSGSVVCTTVQDTYTLKVNRQALVSVPSTNINICEPARIDLSGTIGGSATTGSWSLIAGGGTLSVSSLTGLTVTATYDSASSDVNSTLTFRLSSNDPDGAGPCAVEFVDVDYNIETAARVFAGPDFSICEYDDITLNGSFGGSASSVSWTGGAGTYSTQNQPSTDYFLTAGERTANGLVLTFTLTTNTPVGVCPSVFDQVNVTVNDTLSSVVITPVLAPVYAENDAPVDLTFAGSPVGGIFSGPGVAGNFFFPSIANVTPISNLITYTYTDGAGCISAPKKRVIVNPITIVSFSVQNESPDPLGLASGYVCASQGDLILIENPIVDIPSLVPPENAVYSSPDLPIAAIFFDPVSNKYKVNTNIVSPNVYTITYTFTNSLGASNPVSRLIRFTASPTASTRTENRSVSPMPVRSGTPISRT